MNISCRLFFSIPVVSLSLLPAFAATQAEITAANGVIERFVGEDSPIQVQLQSIPDVQGCPTYQTRVSDGKLLIDGSDGVSLCKGFYDFIKSQGAGINSWSGTRLQLPKRLLTKGITKVVSPVPHHYYLNVVTYGYTMPYWSWQRWQQEIDWMALHGIDMPLALVAHEAITARVFKKLGLTDKEIGNYFVGPAHLPWMRMGNISGIDGPLPQEWHHDQLALQHQILKRMRDLGMTPICPGFSGFVPQAIKRLFPDIQLVETHWGGHFKNWMISPDQKLFSKIGKMFVEEWEKEFGKCSHYLVDSFNEMDVPFPPHGTPERYAKIADYGDKVYQSIKEGSPDAVWVMQGWMFGYQRNIWDEKSLGALVSKVPDDKMLLLDLAVDYNKKFWNNGVNWDLYKGFFNKKWVYSVIPNMGGKTGLTGDLEFYANGHLDALNSPNRGQLTAIGMAPEGIENNEVIYELIADSSWKATPTDLGAWLENYNTCRYGKSPAELKTYWELMRRSVYGSFTDHPRYSWQFRPGTVTKGSINTSPEFYKAIECFASCSDQLAGSPLYVYDLMEQSAAYIGGKLEILIQASELAMQAGEMDKARQYENEIQFLMLGLDRLLESHPIYRLDLWIKQALHHSNNDAVKKYYEKNARRIVTIWGPPVDDYAAKIWSGLIRDYYLPRRQEYLKGKFGGQSHLPEWERKWVENPSGITPCKPYENPVAAARELIRRAGKVTPDILAPTEGTLIGTWSPETITAEWQDVSWPTSFKDINNSKAVRFLFTRGNNKLEISQVSLEMDGKIVAMIKQNGTTGTVNSNNTYQFKIPKNTKGNNSCHIIARVRSDGKAISYGNVELMPAEK